ncbi:MAG TPA: agmatinase [Dehalococcoidia bacterium]|nr:agmatinase [Dehalococcoidia bacterium]
MADQRFYPPLNFASLDEADSAFERARVVVLPVPYDSTVTARAGARDGPRAIIEASADMELYDVGPGLEPWRHGIHTLPELAPHTGSPEAMIARIEEVAGELIDAGKFVVTLGGEHTVAVGPARAHAKRRPGLSVLALDAHSDLRDEYLDSRYNHACTLRRALDVARVTQVGLRSAPVEDAALIRERGLAFFSPAELRARGARAVVDELSDAVYVTIDLDCFDPSEMSAVGTPEPGGLHWDEVSALLAAVSAERRVVGFDVTELSPSLGPRSCAQLAAKLAYRLIGLALGPAE